MCLIGHSELNAKVSMLNIADNADVLHKYCLYVHHVSKVCNNANNSEGAKMR